MTLSHPCPRPSLDTEIKRPSREMSEDRSPHLLWLDKNENTDPMYLALIEKLMKDIPPSALFGYPDCYALYHKLSNYLSLPINHLFIAAGSDGIIRSIYETFISPGDLVILTEPTFAMYALYTKMYAATPYVLHYEPSDQGPILSADKVIKSIRKMKPKLVCLPNPNSPTGSVFLPDELQHIIEIAASVEAVILIDEAYYPFYPETAIALIEKFPNLVISRTFSKAWGLAGIRIGFSIAGLSLTQWLHKTRPMYEAGTLSILLATRIVDYAAEMLSSVKRLNQGKEYFLNKMRDAGFRIFASEGNFLHVAFDKQGEAIHQTLEKTVLYRKNFNHPSLFGYSRFTATTQSLFEPIVQQISAVRMRNR